MIQCTSQIAFAVARIMAYNNSMACVALGQLKGRGRGGLGCLPTSVCVVQGESVNGLMPQFPLLQAGNSFILLMVTVINNISQTPAI